jgi:hypothetical protein
MGDGDAPPPLALQPAPDAALRVEEKLAAFAGAPLLGVTWRAGTPRPGAARAGALASLSKEAPVAALGRALAAWPGEVLVTTRDVRPGEIEAFAAALGRPAHDCSAVNERLDDMLALIARLDEYVGVSSTNMHLRAAAGRSARVLVPAPAEWRWMAAGDTTPWFPGFRVHRQDAGGRWDDALERVARELSRGSS